MSLIKYLQRKALDLRTALAGQFQLVLKTCTLSDSGSVGQVLDIHAHYSGRDRDVGRC